MTQFDSFDTPESRDGYASQNCDGCSGLQRSFDTPESRDGYAPETERDRDS